MALLVLAGADVDHIVERVDYDESEAEGKTDQTKSSLKDSKET